MSTETVLPNYRMLRPREEEDKTMVKADAAYSDHPAVHAAWQHLVMPHIGEKDSQTRMVKMPSRL